MFPSIFGLRKEFHVSLGEPPFWVIGQCAQSRGKIVFLRKKTQQNAMQAVAFFKRAFC
jgi:hypothetical protein